MSKARIDADHLADLRAKLYEGPATENWMASGVAVLLIAAFSPVVIFSALRFAHGSAGSIARGWAGTAASMAPTGRLLGSVRNALRPFTRPIGRRISSQFRARLNGLRSRQ
jgi:hypothetical protein